MGNYGPTPYSYVGVSAMFIGLYYAESAAIIRTFALVRALQVGDIRKIEFAGSMMLPSIGLLIHIIHGLIAIFFLVVAVIGIIYWLYEQLFSKKERKNGSQETLLTATPESLFHYWSLLNMIGSAICVWITVYLVLTKP